MDLSGRKQPTIAIPHALCSSDSQRSPRLQYHSQVHPDLAESRLVPFPPGTQGFLHFHLPEDGPPMAGEIRFRVTAGPEVSAFDGGSDLLMPHGVLWKMPLVALSKPAHSSRNHDFQKLLLSDKFITSKLMAQCSRLYDTVPHMPVPRSVVIHSINQLIYVSFQTVMLPVYVVKKDLVRRVLLNMPFRDQSKANRVKPLIYLGKSNSSLVELLLNRALGSAMCRFERSVWPGHEDQRRLVMRVVKIMEPAQLRIPGCDSRLPPPVEGELLMTHITGSRHVLQPWSIDLDEERYADFRTLL